MTDPEQTKDTFESTFLRKSFTGKVRIINPDKLLILCSKVCNSLLFEEGRCTRYVINLQADIFIYGRFCTGMGD